MAELYWLAATWPKFYIIYSNQSYQYHDGR